MVTSLGEEGASLWSPDLGKRWLVCDHLTKGRGGSLWSPHLGKRGLVCDHLT